MSLVRRAFAPLLALLVGACGATVPGTGSRQGDGGVGTSSGGASGSGAGGSAFCGTTSTSCDCTTGTAVGANGQSCNNQTVPNAVCCAQIGWPGGQTVCSCNSYLCQARTDGSCSCDLESGGATSTCSPQAGMKCCQHVHSSCECGLNVTCDTSVGDVAVTTCTAATAQCPSSTEQIVTACQ